MNDFAFGHSVTIGYADAGETTGHTSLARVVSVEPPPLEADEVETSHMESEEQWREFAATWAEIGELSLTLQYSAERRTELYGLFRQMKSWKVEFVDGSSMTFDGFIKSLPQEIDREGIITQNVTIRGSGKPSFAEPAA